MVQPPDSIWFVYVIKCNDGSFYTGITVNPEKRFRKHIVLVGNHFLSQQCKRPFTMHPTLKGWMYVIREFSGKKPALHYEKFLKTRSRERKNKLMRKSLQTVRWLDGNA